MGLTQDEADLLLGDVDQNLDNYIDFPEFCSMMVKAKRWHMKRLMLYAGRSVLSKKAQPESCKYLLEYNCWPPPLFMLFISVVQIAIYVYYALDSDVGFSPVGKVVFSEY